MQQLAARSKRNIHVATDAIHGIHSLSANSYTTNRICILPSYHLAVLPSLPSRDEYSDFRPVML
jgi:hypothetical protein